MTKSPFESQLLLRLHAYRKELGLSKDHCQQKTGISEDRWGEFQRGTGVPPTPSEFAALQRAGFDLVYVLTGQPARDDLEEDERILLKNYRDSNEPGKQALRRVGIALAQPDLDLGDDDADDSAFRELIRIRQNASHGRR